MRAREKKFKARKKRVWRKLFIEASQRRDNQHHVKQTAIFSPTCDVRKEAYQRQGNKLVKYVCMHTTSMRALIKVRRMLFVDVYLLTVVVVIVESVRVQLRA